MMLWFRPLPKVSLDPTVWAPFIQNNWYREHYMKFVYLLQVVLLFIPTIFSTQFSHIHTFALILTGFLVFILHECLHILVINNKGDISITFSGIFFWINTNAILSKPRFWVFMSLPFIVLSIVPFVLSFYVSGDLKLNLLFISWFNTLISASDIINSFLIALKPKNALFCRGYVRVE
ncbi:hypothetical protein B4U37_14345 [Sutcliffiella horikoshii]|uniref:DUF3267 domain-containing protein n=1 Tax=Sutcliffiella horikoshii TaxID=79883 RepID=A0ABM6KKY7_9BACI|nr:DUF3267 domain-containing protein [Sutcliffiella horikoshii]ART77155.1 hypothetical protein B4U37_14345 [Sutcliffiella horikoshii]